ncbi:caspase-1, partial [Reticulomyxa filosa]
KLHKNKKQYDALIIIISGHGDEGDVLVTSDGEYLPIDEIKSSFDCNRMGSLKNCPKIFIIDICRGSNVPQIASVIQIKGKGKEQNNIHNNNGFLMIWSTTKGYQVGDLSLFSETMKNTIISKYKIGYPLSQMLREVRENIKKKGGGEWYCVESQDTIDYDISFQQRKRSCVMLIQKSDLTNYKKWIIRLFERIKNKIITS